MKDLVTLHEMIRRYNNMSFTHHYILGFVEHHKVYWCVATSEILPFVCTLDRASRQGGTSLRFKPTNAQKEILHTENLHFLCTEEEFLSIKANCKYNAGEVFEKMITEMFGQVWTKDRVPFTQAGDIEVKGIAYQIKFEKATFASEKSLMSLGR